MRLQQDNEIESARPVGLGVEYVVEFACVVENRRRNRRRVYYHVRIDGIPSSASFYLEDERTHPALADAETEAATSYIRKFLREGITDGIETILLEALHLTHTKGELSDKAFFRDIAKYLKDSSQRRLKSDVAPRTRRNWQKIQATALVHRDLAFFKGYRAKYRRHYKKYVSSKNRHDHEGFLSDVWFRYQLKMLKDNSPEYLALALRVAQAGRGGLTPKRAALEWASRSLHISPETLERHYLYRKKKPAKRVPRQH